MLHNIELHEQALSIARMLRRSHSVIRFAMNGSFELAFTYRLTDTALYA